MRSPRAAVGTNTKEKRAQRGTNNGSRTKMTYNVTCKACAAAGAFFGEATAVRFRPRLLDALAAFSGAHGLRHARCVFRLPRDWIGASNIRRDASLEPGGALGDLGAHCAAALLAIDTGWRVDRSSVSVDERGAIVAATAAYAVFTAKAKENKESQEKLDWQLVF